MLTPETLAQIAQQHGVLTAQKSRGEAVAGIAFAVAEYQLGTGGMGWLNGRFAAEGHDHMRFAGVPVDAAVGAAGIAGAVFGVFGSFDIHVAAIAAGSLGAFTYRKAFEAGAKARLEQEEGRKVLTGATVRGEMHSSRPEPNVVSIDSMREAAR